MAEPRVLFAHRSSSVVNDWAMPGIYTTIDQVLKDLVAPLVEEDGGELFVVQHDESELLLHLRGRFSGCPGNTLAIRRVIEPAVLAVAPTLRITVSSGELIPEHAQPYPPRAVA